MSFPGKKKWNKKERGEGRKRRFIRSAFRFIYVEISILPPVFLFCPSKTWNDIAPFLSPKRWYEKKKKKRKGNRDRVSFRRLEDRCTHEEKFTFVEVWTVTESSLWLQARGREGGIPTAFWFSTGKKTWSTSGSGTIYHRSWLCYWLRRKINADSHFHVNYPRHIGRCRKRETDSRCAASSRAFFSSWENFCSSFLVMSDRPCREETWRENMIKLFWLKKKKKFSLTLLFIPSLLSSILYLSILWPVDRALELSSLPNNWNDWILLTKMAKAWRGVDRVIGSTTGKIESGRSYRPSHRRRTWNIVTGRFKIVLRVYNLISPETDSGQYEGNRRFDRSCTRFDYTSFTRSIANHIFESRRRRRRREIYLKRRMGRYRVEIEG